MLPTPDAPLTAQQDAACARLLAALPPEVDPGVERRSVEGSPARLAAWGDPPVVLTCGVAAPDRPDEPVQVDGLEFTVRDVGAGFRWTTSGLPVAVAVDVPDAYDNGAEIVLPLVEPIRRSVG